MSRAHHSRATPDRQVHHLQRPRRMMDSSTIENFSHAIAVDQRGLARELTAWESAHRERPPMDLDPSHTAAKVAEWTIRADTEINAARGTLTSVPGRAAVAQAEAWLAGARQQLAGLMSLAEAFALFRIEVDVEGYGEIAFTT